MEAKTKWLSLWLDDVREAPKGWVWVKNMDQFRTACEVFNGEILRISFDNDLGAGEREGWEIANWLLREVKEERIQKPEIIEVHSMNPVARDRIKMTAKDILGA